MRKRIFLCSAILALLAAGCAQASDVNGSENQKGIFEEVNNALKTEGVTKEETPETPEVTEAPKASEGPLWTKGGEDYTWTHPCLSTEAEQPLQSVPKPLKTVRTFLS